MLASGAAPLAPLQGSQPVFWLWNEVAELLFGTLPACVDAREPFEEARRAARDAVLRVAGGRDAVLDLGDPLPFLALYYGQASTLCCSEKSELRGCSVLASRGLCLHKETRSSVFVCKYACAQGCWDKAHVHHSTHECQQSVCCCKLVGFEGCMLGSGLGSALLRVLCPRLDGAHVPQHWCRVSEQHEWLMVMATKRVVHLGQVPLLLLRAIRNGNPWLKVDLCTGKLVELGGD